MRNNRQDHIGNAEHSHLSTFGAKFNSRISTLIVPIFVSILFFTAGVVFAAPLGDTADFDDAWAKFAEAYKAEDFPACEELIPRIVAGAHLKYPPQKEPERYFESIVYVCNVYNVRARPAEMKRVLQGALQKLEQAWGADDFHLVQCLNRLGAAHKQNGEPEDFERVLRRAIAIDAAAPAEQRRPAETAQLFGNLASALDDRGDYWGALVYRREAVRLLDVNVRDAHDAGNLGRLLLGIAQVYALQRNDKMAEDYLNLAQRMLQVAVGRNTLVLVVSEQVRARTLMLQGDYLSAEKVMNLVLAQLRMRRPDDPVIPQIIVQLGECLLYQGRLDQAQAAFDEAAKSGAQSPQFTLLQCRLHALRKNWKSALDGITSLRRELASQQAQSLAVLPDALQIAYTASYDRPDLQRAFALALAADANSKPADASLEWWINAKARGTEAFGLRSRALRSVDPMLADGLREQEREVAIIDAELYGKQLDENTLPQALQRQEKLDAIRIKLLSAEQEGAVSWLTLGDLRGAMPQKSVYIDIAKIVDRNFHSPPVLDKSPKHRYVAWIVRPDRDAQLVDLGSSEPIDSAISVFMNFMAGAAALQNQGESELLNVPAAWGTEKLRQAALDKLSNLVWRPLSEHLPTSSADVSLIISPDADLWNVPWECLLQDEKFVIERFGDVRYVTTARELLALPTEPSAQPAAVLIGPSFAVGECLSPIPQSFLDFKSIAASLHGIYGTKCVQLPSEATDRQVFMTVDRPSALIVCTHGIERQSEQSAADFEGQLQLVRPNPLLLVELAVTGWSHFEGRGPNPSGGALTAFDIAGMDLTGTQMAFLAACVTAQGHANGREGENWPTLRSAFHVAGARHVVGSLWDVELESSKKFVQDFFHDMRPGDESRRLADLKRLRLRNANSAHPYYWAPWTLSSSGETALR